MIYKDNTTYGGTWRTTTYAARYRSYLTPPSNPFREGKTKLQMLKELFLVLLLVSLLMVVLAQITRKSGKERVQPTKLVVPGVLSEQVKPLRRENEQYVPVEDGTKQDERHLRKNDRTEQSISRTSLNEYEKKIEDSILREDNFGYHDAIENSSEELTTLNESGNKSVILERHNGLLEEKGRSDPSQGNNQDFVENERIPNESPESINVTEQR